MEGKSVAKQIIRNIQGTPVPALGFGTWPLKGPECREAVRDALAVGYRHIDTARMYANEEEVRKGLKDSGLPREEIFLTTKLWFSELRGPKVKECTEESLRTLQTEYLDLLLIHWPNPKVNLEETITAMQQLQVEGKVRQIGMSNFPSAMLKEALQYAPIFCNQVEYHPFLGQTALSEVCRQHDVLLTAYSPVAHGAVKEDTTLAAIGQKYGKSPVQITLRWLVQQDHVAAIPKASSQGHRLSNLDIFDFALTPEEMALIFGLARNQRLIHPAWAPEWD